MQLVFRRSLVFGWTVAEAAKAFGQQRDTPKLLASSATRRLRCVGLLVLPARKVLIIAMAAWLSVACGRCVHPCVGQTGESADMMTQEAHDAVERGLTWLASRQQEDGAFGSGTGYARNVAVTSLCGMAFLCAGHTPNRGPYGRHVTRAVEYVLAASGPNGYINVRGSESHGPMYGHGFATLFLAEVYGMSQSPDIHLRLKKAVELIVNTQNDEGGWRYYPEPKDADISVTACQVVALRAARHAGIGVPKSTIDRCVAYVCRCQNPDGGFRYQLDSPPESLFPRSAAAVVALQCTGIYDGEDMQLALDYVIANIPRKRAEKLPSHYYYGRYYGTQALWQAGGKSWKEWYPTARDELIGRQLPNGRWPDLSVGDEYATAMACMVLQMPKTHLPVFRR